VVCIGEEQKQNMVFAGSSGSLLQEAGVLQSENFVSLVICRYSGILRDSGVLRVSEQSFRALYQFISIDIS